MPCIWRETGANGRPLLLAGAGALRQNWQVTELSLKEGQAMRAYVITSGLLFGLVFLAHIARVVLEGQATLRDPFFVGSSLLALGMVAWCAVIVRGGKGSGAKR
jgi:hypothetical protein